MRKRSAKLASDQLAEALAGPLPSGSVPGQLPLPTPQQVAEFLAYELPPEVEPAIGFTFPPPER